MFYTAQYKSISSVKARTFHMLWNTLAILKLLQCDFAELESTDDGSLNE